jgi:nicotinamide mononucleotide transporter
MKNIAKVGYGAGILGSAALVAASYMAWVPLDLTEVLGFVTGGWCVWLIVKENIWNWPIGIANSIFFAALFWQSRLFADMGLQLVYIVLGFFGWYWWMFGSKEKTELRVSRTPRATAAMLALLGIALTIGMTWYLRSVSDAAPFLDALTTVMSLVAQYLLTKKYIENWYVWLSADAIYIFLYASKDLYLTAVLYGVFFGMCIAGLRSWHISLRRIGPEPAPSLANL